MGRSRSLIQFIDSLFYETTVTTKRTITRRYYDQAVCNRMRLEYAERGIDMIVDFPQEAMNQKMEELIDSAIPVSAAQVGLELLFQEQPGEQTTEFVPKPTSITVNEDYFEINGRQVRIPEKVKTKPPLIIDGHVNHQSFPDYRHAKLAISYLGDTRKFASFDGSPLGRQGELNGWTRKDVFVRHASCTDQIQNDPQVTTAKAQFEDLILSFATSSEWVYLSIVKPDGSILQIYQDNVKQFENDGECIILAHAYARAALLTYDAVREPIAQYNENDLATIIFTLFLAERV